MSEKEKRILVLEVNPDCKALKFDGDPFDEEDVVYCDKNGRWERIKAKDCKKCKGPVLAGITRAEAVDRMAKAICKIGVGCNTCINENNKEECKRFIKGTLYLLYAKSALDALLGKEVKNER